MSKKFLGGLFCGLFTGLVATGAVGAGVYSYCTQKSQNEQQALSEVLDEKPISKLSERERTIINLRFGLENKDGQEMTQKEVAAFLGISQSYISRLEKKIMRQLKKEMSSHI